LVRQSYDNPAELNDLWQVRSLHGITRAKHSGGELVIPSAIPNDDELIAGEPGT
jgi:hypothetical protein